MKTEVKKLRGCEGAEKPRRCEVEKVRRCATKRGSFSFFFTPSHLHTFTPSMFTVELK
jgi:hypothetical protein